MNYRKYSSGFTLIEVMVVVAILAIIAAFGYQSYQEYVQRARRATAAGCLLEQAQFMERFYTTNMTYAGAALRPVGCMTDLANFYQIQFNAAPVANQYLIDAIPIGPQAADVCGTMSINQLGVRTPDPVANPQCWR